MNRSTRRSHAGVWAAGSVALLLTLSSFARPAGAFSYVDQPLTLRSSAFELGLGLGFGHIDQPDYNGLGVNLELAYGISSRLELRFRGGLRLGENGRVTDADRYGRPVETETYNLGNETIANPQVGLRFLLARGESVELGLDVHAILPVDEPFGLLLGLPLTLHLGGRLRIDSGLFVPILFTEPENSADISIPLHLLFQVNPSTFLGPLTGVTFVDGGGRRVPFGIAAGSSLSYDAEVRFWLLFPDIRNDGADYFGLGAGLYIHF